nr:hypothetical protein [Tanacetum cinerariifolium]
VVESSSAAAARPTRGFRVDYGFFATLDDEIRRDPEREAGYGITDTWDEMLAGMLETPTTDETELGRRMTNFITSMAEFQRQQGPAKGPVQPDAPEEAENGTKKNQQINTSHNNNHHHYLCRLKVLIDQGIANALVARDADRSRNGEDSHDFRIGVRRQAPLAQFQRQQGPAKGPVQPDAPEEAGSIS